MTPSKHPLSRFVAQTHQDVWKGSSKDKWKNLHEFMLAHPTVLVERKYNGTRAFFISDSTGKQVLATKHNGVYSKADYPELFESLKHIPNRTILDGELVKGPIVPAGTQTFFYIFDYLSMEGSDSIQYKPLKNRKLLLNELSLGPHARLIESPVCTNEDMVRVAFETAVDAGFEGIVVKDPEASYRVGRSWLKIRDTDTIDAFVIANDPPDANGIVWTYEVALFDNKEAYHGQGYAWTARVSSAESDVDRRLIKHGTVLELRFNTFEGKIVFPGTIVRIRTDKTPEECTTEQL